MFFTLHRDCWINKIVKRDVTTPFIISSESCHDDHGQQSARFVVDVRFDRPIGKNAYWMNMYIFHNAEIIETANKM